MPFLFLLVIVWIMETTANGIQRADTLEATWWPWSCGWLGNLVSHSQSDSRQDHSPCKFIRGVRAEDQREEDGTDKYEHLSQYPIPNQRRIHQSTRGGGVFLVYLESMINKHRDTNQSITTRIGKARQVFITLLKKIWAAKGIRFKTGFSTPMSSHVLWMRDMANNKDHSAEDHDIYQPLSEAHHLQKPKTRGKRDRHHAVVQLIGWIGHTLRKPVSSTTRPPRTHRERRRETRPCNSWRLRQ